MQSFTLSRFVTWSAISILLVGCGKPASKSLQSKGPLVVQTASGGYLLVDCLKKFGLTAQSKQMCRAQSATSAKGIAGGRESVTWTYYSQSYVIYPPNYNQSSLCALFGSSRCYGFFDYPTYSTSYGSGYGYGYTYHNGGYSMNCDPCLTAPFSYSCLSGSHWSCVYPSTPVYTGCSGTCWTPVPTPAPTPTPTPTPTPVPAPTPPASSQVRVACVGGPAKPAYAFYDFGSANACAHTISNFGHDCQQYVQIHYCMANSWEVGSTFPGNCVCNPQKAAVGTWAY